MSEGTVTITGPGMAPVTLTDSQLKDVADKLSKKGKGMSNKEQRRRTAAGHGDNGLDETTRAKLQSIVARVERLEEEKKGVADDIKEVMAQAKALGFDTKAVRAAIRLRKIDKAEREEAQMILDLYMDVIGD